ncbi:retrovirus-related pol polyprotein from transposon TNT 1-94 [Tanacetum coccineum]
MEKIQEVTPDVADNSRPIFDNEPLQKVHNSDDDYNVFANERQHLEQPESVNDTYMMEQGDNNITHDSLDMINNKEEADQDDQILQKERELLASLIDQIKIEIDGSKQHNKTLESSNKSLKKANMFLQSELTREYYYTDHMNAILGVYIKLDKVTNLQCDYLETLDKCQSLENELSKRNTTSKIFEALQQHAINLELALHQCQEQINSEKVWKQKESSSFRELNVKFFEIQDLKAQLQDKDIAISELKKLIEKMKRKFVETKFEKPSVIRQPNAFKFQRSLVLEKFLGTVKFRNDQFAQLLVYGDLVQGNVTIKRVYYVKGLNHNLFFVDQFCDADLEVAFRKSTYTTSPNPSCLMAKATLSQAWLWHRRLSQLNFDTINLLSKNDILIGLPKLKFLKIIFLLLSINGKKYVLVIVEDYSRYTWTHFLRSKDENLKVFINLFKLVQRGLHAHVRTIRTKKGMEFLNTTLHDYFSLQGIEHQTSVARTPKWNAVVERQNRTLVEAARTMLSAAKVPLFFWAEAIATAHHQWPKTVLSMFDEYFTGATTIVSKSFVLPTADASDKHQQQNITLSTSITVAADLSPLIIQTSPEPTIHAPTQAPTVTTTENNDQAETQAEVHIENAHIDEDEFINIFKPMNIKEAMADHAWIEAMQEELHQFERLGNTVIHNKACLVAKGYSQKEGIDIEESFAPGA